MVCYLDSSSCDLNSWPSDSASYFQDCVMDLLHTNDSILYGKIPHTICRSLLPIFHGSIFLPYYLMRYKRDRGFILEG